MSFVGRLVNSSARRLGRCPRTLTVATNSRKLVYGRHSSLHHCLPASRRWATSTTPHSSTADPAELEAMRCLEQGTQQLEQGDVEGAQTLYKRSVEIKRNASSLFNLGVTHYHLKQFDEAIAAWKESISLEPSSADAHTNLASAYIISPVPRPDLALHHLSVATSLAPTDGEVAFNYAAVLEACNDLDNALKQYQRANEFGIERASMHIRNVSAKILGQKMKEQQQQQPQELDSQSKSESPGQ